MNVSILCAAAAAAAECRPDPAARAALREWHGEVSENSVTAERKRRIDQLASAFPADAEIQIRRLSFYRGALPELWPALRAQSVRRAEEKPDDPLALLVAAEALTRTETPRAIELLRRARDLPAGYPVAALRLTEIHQTGRFTDAAQARENLNLYLERCAEYIPGFAERLLSTVADQPTQATTAKRLRAWVEGETAPDPADYQTLWALEFRSRPPAEHPELRKQVLRDVDRLTALQGDIRLFETVLAGLRQGGASRETIVSFEERVLREAPASRAAYRITSERWRKDHPEPANQADLPAWNAWRREYIRAVGQWAVQFTGVPSLSDARRSAMVEAGALPDQQLIAAVEQGLRLKVLRNTAAVTSYVSAAQRLLRKGAVVRAHYWLSEAWLRAEARDRENIEDDRLTEDRRAELAQAGVFRGFVAADYLKAITLLGNRAVPNSLRRYVEGRMPPKKEDRAARYRALAWLAAADRRRSDSLAFFQKAVVERSPAEYYRGRLEDPVLEEARTAFLRGGGTPEGFALWSRETSAPAVAGGAWEQPKQALPEFTLPDIGGRSWKLTESRGKALLINLWATWCGVCREELPQVQKLYESVKGRSDVQVISFNVDEDIGSVAPFLAERGYTFPTILAHGFVHRLLGNYTLPQNWVVDSNGRWVAAQVGFDAKESAWVDSTLKRLESAARAAAAP